MNFFRNILNALALIRRNKVRSFLTMLGIVIGVMSMIIILSVGAGAQSLILNQVKSLGANLVGILPGKSDDKGPPAAAYGIVITTLTAEDGKALLASIPSIKAVASYVRGADTITWNENKTDTTILGTSASYLEVEDARVEKGRFFNQEEENGNARVVVLGSSVAKDLFGDLNPLGEKIKIKRAVFEIIGVMKERGSSGFQNQDNQVFVPVTSVQKSLLGIRHVSFIRAKIARAEQVDSSMEAIRQTLRIRHNIDNPDNDDFSVRSTNQGLDTLSTITNALRFFLAAISAISLLVGGIGIMNIMLAAVQERTKEIGLRKAVGAKSSQIVSQFLIETIVITFAGGLIGIILGSLISVLVAEVAQSKGYSWDLVISPMSIILGCGVSIGIGFIFGVVPARRASRLDPMEALRYE